MKTVLLVAYGLLIVYLLVQEYLRTKKKDASADWPVHHRMKCVLDFSKGSLNGIKLGDPAEYISALGKPSNPNPFESGLFFYFGSGFDFGAADAEVDSFSCFFLDQMNLGYVSCDLELKYQNTSLKINKDSTVEAIKSFLGDPHEITNREDNIVYVYDLKRHNYEFEFLEDGKIVSLSGHYKKGGGHFFCRAS